jgi:molybdopterin converting factor small subunit
MVKIEIKIQDAIILKVNIIEMKTTYRQLNDKLKKILNRKQKVFFVNGIMLKDLNTIIKITDEITLIDYVKSTNNKMARL